MEFIPIRDRLLVKKIENAMKTRSGLTLSDDTKERPTKGEVLAVGQGKLHEDGKTIPMVIKKGDHIVYPKYAGHPIKLEDIEYLILDEDEVLGVLKGESNNG